MYDLKDFPEDAKNVFDRFLLGQGEEAVDFREMFKGSVSVDERQSNKHTVVHTSITFRPYRMHTST